LINILGEQKQAFLQKLAAAGQGSASSGPDGNGTAAETKSADAGTDYSDGGHVGRRRGIGEKSAADIAFEEALGIPQRIQERRT
jgi:hypothetical protein